MNIKPLIKKLINKQHGRNAVRNRFTDLKNMLKTENPLILDVGANDGGMIELFKKQYQSPTIRAFEPIPEMAEKLAEKYNGSSNTMIHKCALGAKQESKILNITNNLVSSSLLKPTAENYNYHGSPLNIAREIPVSIQTLHNHINQNEVVDLLKIDAQGYELEILKGAQERLSNIRAITVEVEFVPMYEGQALFADIDAYMRANNYFLYNLYEIWTHRDGQIEAADATYLNKKYFQIGQNH